MPRWTRKKAFEPEHEDWVVLRDGLVVGRVHLDITQGYRLEKWFWAVITMPAQTGYEETMEAALERVRALATDKWGHKPHGWPIK